ncbi:MAG: class I SAM-dependent DNA methyltransferase [Solirubrobacteraceae bacterium]
MTLLAQLDPTADAYDCLAPYYDEFTTGYAHDAWVAAIERRAVELGLTGWRALDIACGTGKSTAPLLSRGYSVLACDISAEMVREAQRKFPAHADSFLVADMRELPSLGEFDLILCLDDAVNYLLSEHELQATFTSVAAVLAPDGIFAFDLNSLQTYRSSFAQAIIRQTDGRFFGWHGESTTTIAPGQTAAATVEIFAEREDGLWERRSSRHVQRHHPPEVVRRALRRAGLECRSVAGQLAGAQLEAGADEQRHIKLVYFAQRVQTPDLVRG